MFTQITQISVNQHLHITYHDGWKKIELNGQPIPLTPTEYRLCKLLIPSKPVEIVDVEAQLNPLKYTDIPTLQRQGEIANTRLLGKHINNINAKLSQFGLNIAKFQRGYMLFSTHTEKEKLAK